MPSRLAGCAAFAAAARDLPEATGTIQESKMQRRLSLVFSAVLFWVVAALFAPAPLRAQISIVAPAGQTSTSNGAAGDTASGDILNDSSTDIKQSIAQGQTLESERRWGEALTLYEDTLRRFPRDPAIQERLQLARIHYDLGRRYNDNSFKKSLTKLPERDALDLYGEVLLKVQSHYVDTPNWKNVIDYSTKAYLVALADPVFVEHNLAGVPQSQIERYGAEVTQHVAAWQINSRHHARDAVAYIARLGNDRLGLGTSTSILEFTSGATSGLDPYSTFLTADQLNEVYSQIEGNFVGLGIELKANDGSLLIVKTISGSPAEKAGIRAGDRIVAVDGHSTAEMTTDQAANLLQGKEGTMVEVTLQGPDSKTRRLRIRREQVDVPSIDGGRIVDKTTGIAYLRLTCFQKTTARDLDTELWRLNSLGMKSLIIDLRGNPGGLLGVSVEVVDRFVENGTIVSTRGRGPQEDNKYSAHAPGTWKMPLVVLIDGDSASASEIFAGAIRDHRRGVIVGARSYGKGSVQGIFPLAIGNAGLRLTTAKFLSPLNQPYSGVGVTPDLPVQTVAKPVVSASGSAEAADTQDPALEAAIEASRRQPMKR
jgi:carboxyl-terminal processing protease